MVLGLCGVALLELGQFCEAGETVIYRNDSEIVLVANVEGEGSSKLPPRSTKKYGYIMPTDDPFRLTVTDSKGCVVYEVDTTLDALKQDQDLTIVIRGEDVIKCLAESVVPSRGTGPVQLPSRGTSYAPVSALADRPTRVVRGPM